LGVSDTLELVDGACRGLAHAHRMGVIHRDVKPGNILRSDDGAVKLADFGIAKAMAGGASQITQAGSVLGTAAYLAPEQASGAEVGPPADLYGLGVVTYQLLAGRLPYDAASLTELALMQQRTYPIRLDELAPEVPAALALAVERALELEPEQRYARAEDMRRALHDGARGVGTTGGDERTAATSMLPVEDPTAATRAIPSSASRRLQPQAPRTPLPPLYDDPDLDAVPLRSRRDDPRPKRSGGAGRLIAIVLVVGLIAAALAFAYGNTTGGSGDVQITPVDGDSTSKVVRQVTELIDNNTR
jgi:serine/threonine protein kinase